MKEQTGFSHGKRAPAFRWKGRARRASEPPPGSLPWPPSGSSASVNRSFFASCLEKQGAGEYNSKW